MKRLFIFGVCALVVLCMASCYPEGPDYVHEKDIALTHYDEKADFSTLKTFVIPDSVVYVQGDSNATGLANSGGYYYAYDKGTVVIDMLDAKKADKETKRVPVLWTGMVDGILAGNQNYLAERLEKNINQCFIQSPYLKTTK